MRAAGIPETGGSKLHTVEVVSDLEVGDEDARVGQTVDVIAGFLTRTAVGLAKMNGT
jgi:hypothetical protein